MMSKQRVDPASLRGRLVVRVAGVINGARALPDMERQAREQGLTADQLLAAMVTEAVLEVLEGE